MKSAVYKPVIFLAFANDRDDTVSYLRDLPNETRKLREILETAEGNKLCEVVVRSNCTADDIFKVFQDSKFRDRIAVFHYGGHANGFQLLLESAEGKSAPANAIGLAEFLAQQHGLQLAFLNGCSTQQQSEGLLAAGVSTVIVTTTAVADKDAVNFACRFYTGLVGTATIRTAFDEAVASAKTTSTNDARGISFGDTKDSQPPPHQIRWELYPPIVDRNSDDPASWSLQDAAHDPLWNLPLPDRKPLPESPFRYLDRYELQHAELFFGRAELIRELYDALTNDGNDPVILFYGQSGVGKSSVLDAGVCPRLNPTHEIKVVRRDILCSLQETLHGAIGHRELPIREAWLQQERESGKPLIVVLDQVEEIYTRPNSMKFGTEQNLDATEFTDLITAARSIFLFDNSDPKGKLMLSFRKEWLSNVEDEFGKEWSPLKISARPLRRSEIVQAVVGPTTNGPMHATRLRTHYKLFVENELPERIAEFLLSDSDSPVAPMLQIILNRMWEAVRNQDPRRFTLQTFQSLNIRGDVVGDFLRRQLRNIEESLPSGDKPGLLLDLLEYHTSPLTTASEHSTQEIHQVYSNPDYPERQATVDDLIRRCTDAKLLTTQLDDGETPVPRTRLIHDTLAPHVKSEVQDSAKPGQRARRLLMLKTGDDLKNDLLTIAQLRRLQSGRFGTRNYSLAIEDLIRRSKRRLYTQSTVIFGLFMAVLIGSWILVNRQTDRTIAAKLDGDSNEFHQFLISPDHNSRVVEVASRTYAESANKRNSVKARRAAMILARSDHDSEAASELLSSFLNSVEPQEMQNVQAALQKHTFPLSESNIKEPNFERRVKLTALLLSIGQQQAIPTNWYKPSIDPTSRTSLLCNLPRWLGDEELFLAAIIKATDLPRDLESLIYAALRGLDIRTLSENNREQLIQHLLHVYRKTPHAAVRSAAFAALREYNHYNPDLLTGEKALRPLFNETLVLPVDSDFDRRKIETTAKETFVLDFARIVMPNFQEHQDTNRNVVKDINGTLVSSEAISELKNALTSQRNNDNECESQPIADAMFDQFKFANQYCATSFWIGTTEVDEALMRAFRKMSKTADHDAIPSSSASQRIPVASDMTPLPAQNVCWLEAIEFCNWLTSCDAALGATEQCYTRTPNNEEWIYNPAKAGYRLPSEIEWKFACRAWSGSDFWFGQINSENLPKHFHYECVWSKTEAIGRGPLPCASQLPNAFGLFDMHGNVREMGWSPDRSDEPFVARDGAEYRFAFGGAYDTDLFDTLACKSENISDDDRNQAFGLRLVRTISSDTMP